MVKRASKDTVNENAAKKLKLDLMVAEEQNAKALSKQKVVYSRKDEPDTIIVRDVAAEKWNAFGVKGDSAVKNLYGAIIKLLNENRSSLHGLKYGVGEKLIKIINLGSICDETESIRVIENDNGVRKQCIDLDEKVRADFIQNGKKTIQIALLNVEKNDDLYAKVSTGIYLFLSECEKLLRYMNKHFKIVNDREADDDDDDGGKVEEEEEEEKTLKHAENDYFF